MFCIPSNMTKQQKNERNFNKKNFQTIGFLFSSRQQVEQHFARTIGNCVRTVWTAVECDQSLCASRCFCSFVSNTKAPLCGNDEELGVVGQVSNYLCKLRHHQNRDFSDSAITCSIQLHNHRFIAITFGRLLQACCRALLWPFGGPKLEQLQAS